MEIEGKIRQWSEEEGLDIVRFTSAEPLDGERQRALTGMSKRINGVKKTQPEENAQGSWVDRRSWNPSLELDGARSVVCAAVCYLTDEPTPQQSSDRPIGRIARYTWANYYLDCRKKLRNVAKKIQSETGARCKWQSNGHLVEKPLAERSGLGWYGKNGIIITKKHGSLVILGTLVTSIVLKPDRPLKDNCGTCTRCIDACPTGALRTPYILDRERCLQEWTVRNDVFPDIIRNAWGDRLYGCSVCQEVCPRNLKAQSNGKPAPSGHVGPAYEIENILKMDEDFFRLTFKGNQISADWVSLEAIKRNAVVALWHIGGKKALSLLCLAAQHKDTLHGKQAQECLTLHKQDHQNIP